MIWGTSDKIEEEDGMDAKPIITSIEIIRYETEVTDLPEQAVGLHDLFAIFSPSL